MTCNHFDDGMLRARLDNELAGAELEQFEQHLSGCPVCHIRLQALAKNAAQVHKSLSTLMPSAGESSFDAASAYAQFRKELTAETQPRRSWMQQLFTPRWRPVWGLAAAAAIIAVVVGVAPARVWAQKILAMFRVQKIAVVSIDPSTLVSGNEPDSRPYRLINQFLSDNVVVTMDPGKPQVASDISAARQAAGFQVRSLSGLDMQDVLVSGEAAFQMNLNRDRILTLLEEVGRSDIQIPESVNGALVAVHIPKSVISLYGDCPLRRDAASNVPGPEWKRRMLTQNNNCVFLIQAPSPTVSLPPDLKMAEIAEAGLQLAGMTPSEAHAFCQTVDWSSTLVVPVPRNSSSYETVNVDGVEGTLITETLKQSNRYSLLWIKNGVIYSLAGSGDSSQALNLAASLH